MMQTNSPYKTAAELGIEQWEHDGLVALIGPLSRNELPFDMMEACGSVCCIGGWVAVKAGHDQRSYMLNRGGAWALRPLYYPNGGNTRCRVYKATSPQAAKAVVNFLTLCDPRWDDVMRERVLTSNTDRAANGEAAAGALAAIERVLAGDLDDFNADDSGAMTHVIEEVA